tara:strand:- start:46 stop:1104 length:1059 start_codon:yes stop_codon:yes gene_type:complete
MSKKLEIDKGIDSHLKPVKVDGEVSALEISTDKVKTGDLVCKDLLVTGDVTGISSGSGDMTGVDLTGGTGISIDSETNTTSGDYSATITCNVEGTEVASTGEGGGSKFLREDGDGTCSWQTVSSGASALNDLSDVTYSSGDLTISSLDKIIATDFVVDSSASVELDSHNGNFVAKKAGTEFSVTNSAYAGMILGYTRIQNDSTSAADAVINLDSTMEGLETGQGTDLKIVFTAPPSGNVEIIFTGYLYTSSTEVAFALSSTAAGTTFAEIDETHTYDQGTYKMDETDKNTISVSWAVTGLTAGTEYTYYIAGQETSGATSSFSHGRFRTTGKHSPPITIKAVALPASIFTGE